MTYETAQGKWETKQFVGTSLETWEQPTAWTDFGGDGTVKSVTVNGQRQTPDADGNVSVSFDKVEVDESLDASSTNPVQNKAVAAKMAEVEASTVFGMTAEVSDDQSSVRLALTNKSGAEIASADIPAGSGGGGGESSTTKIVLSAAVDHATVKEGGSVRLTYTYDHQNTGGDSTGQKATIQVIIKRSHYDLLGHRAGRRQGQLRLGFDEVPASWHERHLCDSHGHRPKHRQGSEEAGLREREGGYAVAAECVQSCQCPGEGRLRRERDREHTLQR